MLEPSIGTGIGPACQLLGEGHDDEAAALAERLKPGSEAQTDRLGTVCCLRLDGRYIAAETDVPLAHGVPRHATLLLRRHPDLRAVAFG